jgi:hypothetical protein
MRDGGLNDYRFGSRMRGRGIYADQVRALFDAACRNAGFPDDIPPLSSAAFRRPDVSGQLTLF